MIDLQQDNSIFREVDDAMRQEKLQGLLRLFSKYIIALSALVLLATIGYVWWQNNKIEQYQKASASFFQAIEMIDNGKASQAKKTIDELAKNSDEKITLMAQMWQIKLKYLADKQDEATAIAGELMQKMAGKKSVAAYYDWAQLHTKSSAENQIYKLSALEMQAAKHIDAGEMQAAHDVLQRISQDLAAPPTMRDRAEKMLIAIAPKTIAPKIITPIIATEPQKLTPKPLDKQK